MVYSESLAARIRQALKGRRDFTEKRMFGGVGFMLHGNMCVGVWQTSLIVRLGPDQAAAALKKPNLVEFDITGRPMKGWVMGEQMLEGNLTHHPAFFIGIDHPA